jgi:hypothetical protein
MNNSIAINNMHAIKARRAKLCAGNIGHLYVFFIKFNVFIYAVNPAASFRKDRSMTQGARAKTLGPSRFFRPSIRLACLLPLREPGVLLIPTKEKTPAALDALQRFPA